MNTNQIETQYTTPVGISQQIQNQNFGLVQSNALPIDVQSQQKSTNSTESLFTQSSMSTIEAPTTVTASVTTSEVVSEPQWNDVSSEGNELLSTPVLPVILDVTGNADTLLSNDGPTSGEEKKQFVKKVKEIVFIPDHIAELSEEDVKKQYALIQSAHHGRKMDDLTVDELAIKDRYSTYVSSLYAKNKADKKKYPKLSDEEVKAEYAKIQKEHHADKMSNLNEYETFIKDSMRRIQARISTSKVDDAQPAETKITSVSRTLDPKSLEKNMSDYADELSVLLIKQKEEIDAAMAKLTAKHDKDKKALIKKYLL